MERKTYSYSHVQPSFRLYQLVFFLAQSPEEELTFLCTWCDVMWSFRYFYGFQSWILAFFAYESEINQFLSLLNLPKPLQLRFRQFSISPYSLCLYLFFYSIPFLIQQFRITLSVSFYVSYSPLESTYSINFSSTNFAYLLDL